VPAQDVVLDTNVVAAWTFNDQNTSQAMQVKAAVIGGSVTAIVPELF